MWWRGKGRLEPFAFAVLESGVGAAPQQQRRLIGQLGEPVFEPGEVVTASQDFVRKDCGGLTRSRGGERPAVGCLSAGVKGRLTPAHQPHDEGVEASDQQSAQRIARDAGKHGDVPDVLGRAGPSVADDQSVDEIGRRPATPSPIGPPQSSP